MEIPVCHDVFPGSIQLEPVARLVDVPPTECSAFVPHLDPVRLNMNYLHMPVNSRLLLENFSRTYKASRNPLPNDKKLDWFHHVYTRLTLPCNNSHYSDVRMAYRSGNTFLTKKFFTFGQRTVEPFEVHVLQTSQAPLLCYFPRLESSAPSSFPHQRENFYERYVLQPDCIYHFQPGTTYILLTVVQTRFSLDRVTPEVADYLGTLWGVTDPTAHLDFVAKKKRSSPKIPPPPSAAEFVNNFCDSLYEPECILEELSETVDGFLAKYGNVSTGWEEVVMGLYS